MLTHYFCFENMFLIKEKNHGIHVHVCVLIPHMYMWPSSHSG